MAMNRTTEPNMQTTIPGLDPNPDIIGLLAVETNGPNSLELFYRDDVGNTSVRQTSHAPWLMTTERSGRLARLTSSETVLDGPGELRILKRFSSSSLWSDAVRELRSQHADHLVFLSRTEQFLVESGLTLFHGMDFEDLRRAQIDIETLGLNPADPSNSIIIITATLNGRDQLITHAGDTLESTMIEQLQEWIQQHDPDVIEGHNIFNFDLPFLASRARAQGMELRWGRDGSPVRFGNRQRFKAGARTIPYDAAYIRGRHLVDTYQQIQRYDIAGHLSSYGLKPAIAELGLERHDRTHVEGEEIARVWETDSDRLLRYALDDVLDTDLLSRLALPTEFYQTQLLPSSLQSVATGGPGEKVNDLLVRAYVREGRSVPVPGPSASYPGGFTAIRAVGVFGPSVVNADVESLYPSIMLADRIAPRSDTLGVFLPILATLRDQRLRAKRASETTTGEEGARWTGTQASLKVLINSFFGYLGYGRGYFNDFEAAARVTRRGHEIIQSVERSLEKAGATIIEIDTDGIYFVAPEHARSRTHIEQLIDEAGHTAGEGIRLGVDGIWERMLSLKLKNYALLSEDGRLTIKGSSLRSRRDEPFLSRFLRGAIRAFLDQASTESPRDLYLAIASDILAGRLPPEELGRQERITERTFTSDSNRRLARAARGERVGERITVYQRQDGELAKIEQYTGDEDREYLLGRLRAMAERFRPLFNDDAEFEYTFPSVSAASDIAAIASQAPVKQQSLFDI